MILCAVICCADVFFFARRSPTRRGPCYRAPCVARDCVWYLLALRGVKVV